jgi:hypothetical protein
MKHATQILTITIIIMILTIPAVNLPSAKTAQGIPQAPPRKGVSPLVSADFSISASPEDVSLGRSSSTTSSILVSSLNGFTGTVSLTASSTPSGLSLTINPSSGSLPAGCSCTSLLTISTSSSTPTGVYNVTVTGSSTNGSHSTEVDVAVTPITGSISSTRTFTGVTVQTTGSFSLDSSSNSFTFSGTASVLATNATTGATLFSTTYTITQIQLGGYSSNLILDVPISPYALSSNIQVSLGSTSLQINQYSLTRNLDVNFDGNDNDADYAILIAANGHSIGDPAYNPVADINADGTVDIVDIANWAAFYGAQDFGVSNYGISASPTSLNISVGSSSTSTLTLGSQYGFSGTVNLAATVSPIGPTATLSPASVALSSGGSATSTLIVATTSSTPAGSYTVTVNGTSGTRWHAVSVTVNVQDFEVLAPAILAVHNGNSLSATVTVAPFDGFTGTASLTTTMIPNSGPTASVSPSSVTVTGWGGTSTLTIRANGTPGLYNVNVTATSGSLSHTVIVQVATTPLSWSVNDNENFTGVNVKTTGTLSLNAPNNPGTPITTSGSLTVVATNASTGTSLFSKTYQITNLAFNCGPGGCYVKFLLNVAVNPYALAVYVILNLSAPTSTTPGAASVSTVVHRNADINANGIVDISDINTISAAFGCSTGQSCYNPRADINADGTVDISDLAIAGYYYGSTDFI